MILDFWAIWNHGDIACIVFVGTQKPKNGVGDSLCADVRLEVKMIRIRAFHVEQGRYVHQVHVEIVSVWIVCVELEILPSKKVLAFSQSPLYLCHMLEMGLNHSPTLSGACYAAPSLLYNRARSPYSQSCSALPSLTQFATLFHLPAYLNAFQMSPPTHTTIVVFFDGQAMSPECH
jgi:hypothetical protein